MTMPSRTMAVLSVVATVAIAVGWTAHGQSQAAPAAAAQGQGRGRGEPPPPPPPQPGHPSGKLVIWGDMASFDKPGHPADALHPVEPVQARPASWLPHDGR